MISVGLERGKAQEVSERVFRNWGIVVRPFPDPGLNALRVSPNLMNPREEWVRLLEILERA